MPGAKAAAAVSEAGDIAGLATEEEPKRAEGKRAEGAFVFLAAVAAVDVEVEVEAMVSRRVMSACAR